MTQTDVPRARGTLALGERLRVEGQRFLSDAMLHAVGVAALLGLVLASKALDGRMAVGTATLALAGAFPVILAACVACGHVLANERAGIAAARDA